MKLSNGYQYHVLCEDAQMKTFILGVLSYHKIPSGKISVSNIPCGQGSGAAFVRKELSKEIQILKATNYLRRVLIVCIDADAYTVEERMRELHKTIEKVIPKWKREDDFVMFWIPKHQIETWIKHLSGESVDEEMTFIHSGKPVNCKSEAERFAMYCQDLEEIECPMVNSLSSAKKEYIRVCEMQK